jgi:ribosomal protein L6P/L9E
MFKIYLPKNINFLYLNNMHIYIYNSNIFLLLNFLNYSIYFNKFLNIMKIKNKKLNRKIHNKKFLNNFLFTWDNFFFSKIYFLGKGFKLKKINKNIYFNFNYSHIKLLINQKTIIKKIQKTKLLIFSKNLVDIKKLSLDIKNIKNLNPYTKRGLRKSKQIVYKKKNKSNTQA